MLIRHLKNILPAFLLLLILTANSCKKKELLPTPPTQDSTSTPITKPNIVIILIDDIGYEVPQYTGGQSYTTPLMDALSTGGMQFTHCYASAMCSPSRVTLLTGKYGFRNYIDWGFLDTTHKTMANLLKDNGYATCVSGKWQLDGGEASIHKVGFDSYCVFDPFTEADTSDREENEYRYKNPAIYENGTYLPADSVEGKYSDDIFAKYAANFISQNTTKPFFVYFAFSECHMPFSPPPNNPLYDTWDPLVDQPNKDFYPDMVSYMDSKITKLIDATRKPGVQDRTYFFILADNGTPKPIISEYKNREVRGGKDSTNEFGLHVPLIVYGPKITGGTTNNNIVDFTDFLPTIASMASVPESDLLQCGTLDGVPFNNQLFNLSGTSRDWSYGYFNPYINRPFKRIYVQDTTYKLYDNTYNNYFFNLQKDSLETSPIPDSQLTPAEVTIKQKFQDVLAKMH